MKKSEQLRRLRQSQAATARPPRTPGELEVASRLELEAARMARAQACQLELELELTKVLRRHNCGLSIQALLQLPTGETLTVATPRYTLVVTPMDAAAPAPAAPAPDASSSSPGKG